jgi:tetratricopeptide (TPR) repeat protein
VTRQPQPGPLDGIPEGRRYREALDALDRQDFERAEAIRRELAGHPVYGMLAEAIEGFTRLRRGDSAGALAAAEQISSVPALQAEAYVLAGEVFRARGDLQAATGAFQGALQQHRDSLRAHRWLGAIYYDTGAMLLALEHLREVAALDPRDYRALRLAARIHLDYEHFDEAIAEYRAALERQPPAELAATLRLELAETLVRVRRLDAARAELEALPESAAVASLRARVAELGGEMAEASTWAKRALEQQPGDLQANLVLARVASGERQWDAAKEAAQRAVAAHPYDHEARMLLGRALVNAGDAAAGKSEIARSTQLKETFLEFSELHHAALQKPSDVQVRLRLGELAEQLGKIPAARAWYAAALGLDQDQPAAREALARLDATGS